MEGLKQELDVIADSDVEFRCETIYFLVLDRFAIGTPDKQRIEPDDMFDSTHLEWNKYWGGDLQGLIDQLDYLRSFGVSAIWTTPLFEQVRAMTTGDSAPRAPIHGYWTSDFKRINPRWMNDPSEKRLFTRDDTVFDSLLREMHAHDMRFILDIVCNHSSPETGEGKGKLYDDGKLIADFDHDEDHWYHHYGTTTDWHDEWQVQNCEIGGLATFNENNIRYRNHIKEAVKMWIGKGVDALRIDTVKHMPLWFWQEFTSDIGAVNPNVFRFGEWINSHPENQKSVEFANSAGMSILDFGFCLGARLSFTTEQGFPALTAILDQDANYSCPTELVTFFENHDMPRLQSEGVSDRQLELALVLLLTSRGIPCLYYGCEQYLHNDTEGGEDPYNRPMMECWGETPARRLIGILATERRHNQAIQVGGQWTKWVDENTYIYLRRYRESRCLVILNKGAERKIEVENLDFPDGEHTCLISGEKVIIRGDKASLQLGAEAALVITRQAPHVEGKSVVRLLVNGAPTQPGDRLAVIGDCSELGCWDLQHAWDLECVNGNCWFGELAFNESAGSLVGYKLVIFRATEGRPPIRENRTVRRRLILSSGYTKWRDQWEE
ncbi:alpha-amylase family glycosyl hydrolase [Luteolibacter luteus]|uniref:Cyclomaltodextrin glucanotransferase n=1 Tax=Luteolibacter luteus TaxID=2728835 RepID=A0A858REJ2_9BACT|nr:alpha-amylase family glycosyl hydrolase [Luteolibacter luteus]QJE95145.1 cyclomaltodextrin glucanotransferase [Luteolibacter luteus]